jgi:hypothetical protein
VSWTGPWEVVGEGGEPLGAGSVVHTALSEPDGPARLRLWLAEHGVDVAAVTGTPVEHKPRLLAATALMAGPWQGRRDGSFWTTGLLFVEPGPEATRRVPGAQARARQEERVHATAAEGLEALRSRPGSTWIAVEDVVSARVRGLVDPKVDLRLRDDTVLEIRGKAESESFNEPQDVLRELLCDRLVDAKV